MNPFKGLEKLSRDHAERHNIAALLFGAPLPVNVGHRRFTITFEPRRSRYPVRLHGHASGQPLQLDLDAQALLPELARRSLEASGAHACKLIVDACEDWFCALEGLFGFALEVTRVSFDALPDAGAYGLAVTHVQSGRMASVSFHCEAIDRWLRRRSQPPADLRALARRIVVPLPVCLAGPTLSVERMRRIRTGDALVIDKNFYYLRVPLRSGTQRICLKTVGDQIVLDRPLENDREPVTELTSEFIPIDALTFTFDAMIGSLRISLEELSRLRSGSLVSLQISVRERAVTLLCQGLPFAHAELVDIDDVLAVRITSMLQTSNGDATS
ncbi:FliM/FliN family flagellar motor switch protein [Caballeronia sp. LZ034LL]|uniref:FliM/FliN family flagellar motor switch protein n=1 Tax=Caballeronia sp. LZ034LL TaxID=3038567 RepID=UPI002858FD6E|nr:FliM/FliN family flagellar motor switch protein [Caballeronia sp. LZ034LL]MDR5836718.1 FliM/FliN family flagellar motor switch protein [Caballeronia sp. LZ034LL]